MTPTDKDALSALVTLVTYLGLKIQRAQAAELVSQAESPLGARRHNAAVRRRIREGKPGAAVIGRRHLLSREALAEELGTCGKRATSKPDSDLASELGLRIVGGGRRG